jgi:hypothetical protein
MTRRVIFPVLALVLAAACTSPPHNFASSPGEREVLVLAADMCFRDAGICVYRARAGAYEKHGEDDAAEYFWPDRIGGGGVRAGALIDPPKALRWPRGGSSLCVISVFNVEVTCDPLPPGTERRRERVEEAASR